MATIIFILVILWGLHNQAEINKLRKENAELKEVLGKKNLLAKQLGQKLDRLQLLNRAAANHERIAQATSEQ